MKRLAVILACLALVPILAVGNLSVGQDDPAKSKTATKADEKGTKKVVKTDEEWAKILTRDQFYVARQKGTEPAFSGKYATYHGKGTFLCVCCSEPLFEGKNKFESGTGWPSFDRPVTAQKVVTQPDFSDGGERIEVNCSTCGAHLGHVFNDGPTSTGLRYCINSVCLKLDTKAVEAKAKEKARTPAKGKDAKAKAGTPPATKSEAEAPPK